MSASGSFRVVIAGAGLAGLTLANALEQAGVDYVVLERRNEVAPQVGASIGIFPSAARILDQLGVWKGVNEGAETLRLFYTRDTKGNLICPPDHSNLLLKARTGYPSAWGERQNLLRVLHENIKEPSRVLVNKDLVDIKHDAEGVTATCADGSSYRGDILIGADGVFSKTRTKMWELAEPEHPDLIKSERNCLIAEYNCLFGIARAVTSPHLSPGDVHVCHNPKRCALAIVAEGGKVYYFAQERLDKTYRLDNIPRYTAADAHAFVARNGDLTVLPSPGRLTIADLWAKTASNARLVAIEEGKFQMWHWGRMACVGDAIHKSTPNLGVGGNSAIESAAALANGIKRLVDGQKETGARPGLGEIEAMFGEYHRERKVRAEAVVDESGMYARVQNLHGLGSKLFVRFALPQLSEFLPELMAESTIGATKLDYLPLPIASLTGTMPFNPTQGEGLHESRLKRLVFALPLLAMGLTAGWVMNAAPAMPWAATVRDSGRLDLGVEVVPILRRFYQHRGFDDFVGLINAFFFPTVYGTDPNGRRQLISFLTDGTVILNIWIFESVRRANMLTLMQWPALFALAGQVLGLGLVSPFYCLLHYVLSPIEKFRSLDLRLTNTRYSYASLPAVLLTFLLPFYLSVHWPGALATRQQFLYMWQLYPVWMSIALWAGSKMRRDTMTEDKLCRTEADIRVMRWYVGGASVLGAVVWWWAAWFGEGGVKAVFVPGGLPRRFGTLTEFTGDFLRWDEVFSFAAHLLWLGYLFWDLRVAGMLREGWLSVVMMGLVSLVVVGPGATVGLGWLWREHILATRRHKDALTPESVGRLHGKAV
ncbi:hypothetical protein VTI74DRAFT_4042 [Chaetomium olivicolor]